MAEKHTASDAEPADTRRNTSCCDPIQRTALWSGAAGLMVSAVYWTVEQYAIRAGWIPPTVFATRDRAHFDPLLSGALLFALVALFPIILSVIRNRAGDGISADNPDAFRSARKRWAKRDAWALIPWALYPMAYALHAIAEPACIIPAFFLEKMNAEGFAAAERMTAYGIGFCFLATLLLKALAMFRFLAEIATNEWKTARAGLFALCATVYIFTGFWTTAEYPPTGDEPHYLLMAHSLILDRDLDLENNYANRDYLAFRDRLEPQIKTRDGEKTLHHEIAFPLLIFPAYAIGNRHGVVFFLNILAALAVWQLAELLARLFRDKKTAMETASAIAFLTPFLIYASQIFPEIPAALVVILALRLIFSERLTTRWGIPLLCLMLFILPLLKARFWLIAAALVPVAMFLPPKRNRALLALPVVLIAALALFCWIDTHFLGGYAYYGKLRIVLREALENNAIRDYPRFIAALLFDQGSGLMAYAPILLAAFAGVIPLWKESPRKTLLLALLIVFYLIVKSPYWQAGWCPPGRYLICLLPVGAIFLGAALRDGAPLIRKGAAVLAVLSGGILFVLTVLPPLRYPLADGRGPLWEAIGKAGGIPLTGLLPAFASETSPAAWIIPLALSAGGVLAGFLMRRSR